MGDPNYTQAVEGSWRDLVFNDSFLVIVTIIAVAIGLTVWLRTKRR